MMGKSKLCFGSLKQVGPAEIRNLKTSAVFVVFFSHLQGQKTQMMKMMKKTNNNKQLVGGK